MSRKIYPSDVSREQFALIRSHLEGARKKTKPRSVDLYDVFCAVLYLIKSGCQWRMLPSDFPKWENIYAYFVIWNTKIDGKEITLLEEILKKLVGNERRNNGRKEKTTFLIIDAQSVKNTDTAKEKGYDAGKKISGIKRHIAVDTNGLPHAFCVTTANITDRDGTRKIFETQEAKTTCSEVQNVLADGGYTGEAFAMNIWESIGATVEVVKRSELHTFKVIPKRWVLERTFSWLEKCRRLWKNCERKLHTSLQIMTLAFIQFVLRRF